MKTIQKKNGFTLAELLIVVAIIAVLVAISIPIFTTKLEASRESTDAANLRAAYASGTTALLTLKDDSGTELAFSDSATTIKCYYTKSGKLVKPTDGKAPGDAMKGKSQIDGYQGTNLDELPAGVFLYGTETTPDKDTPTVPSETVTGIGNSNGGALCVVLKEKAAIDDYNVIVYFETEE